MTVTLGFWEFVFLAFIFACSLPVLFVVLFYAFLIFVAGLTRFFK